MTKVEQIPLATNGGYQMPLWADDPINEAPDYLSRQLITYIGNKRALLPQIGSAVERVKHRLGKARLRVLDAFSGSGVVSRFFKAHASCLIANDIEDYAAVIARCYLRNKSTVDFVALSEIVGELNARVAKDSLPSGWIEELYSPRDESSITRHDRVFYTKENARRLDHYRQLIEGFTDSDLRDLLLGPLLSKASIHANTAGVFKGFYKDRRTNVGKFGGTNSDALTRIRGTITLEPPVLSRFESDVQVLHDDANKVAKHLRNLDLAYVDPPYNQHPYGSNYFMLNLLVNYKRPTHISNVSGIPRGWRRSGYNVRSRALSLLKDLLCSIDAPFLLVSFNNEGFVGPEKIRSLLAGIGSVEVIEVPYNTFRGSRNLRKRNIHVMEQLFLVERR